VAAADYDMPVIEQGADFFWTLTYKDNIGTPVDLTGYSARMQVREDYSSPLALVDISTDSGEVTLGGAAGTIHIHLSAVETSALDFTTAKYDLEIADSQGVVTRLLQGAVTLSHEITR